MYSIASERGAGTLTFGSVYPDSNSGLGKRCFCANTLPVEKKSMEKMKRGKILKLKQPVFFWFEIFIQYN
jgi:hypothetical protein